MLLINSDLETIQGKPERVEIQPMVRWVVVSEEVWVGLEKQNSKISEKHREQP